jgi:hypothetical protein
MLKQPPKDRMLKKRDTVTRESRKHPPLAEIQKSKTRKQFPLSRFPLSDFSP